MFGEKDVANANRDFSRIRLAAGPKGGLEDPDGGYRRADDVVAEQGDHHRHAHPSGRPESLL